MTHASLNQQPPYDPRSMAYTHFTTKDTPVRPAPGNHHSTLTTKSNGGSATGPAPRLWQHEQCTPIEGSAEPPCLNARGRWDQEAFPHMTLVPSQAQELTAKGADVPPGSLGGTGLGGTHRTVDLLGQKAVGSIHSYADVSPLVATECVHDSEGWADRTSEAWHATTLSKTGDATRAGFTQTIGSSTASKDRQRTQPLGSTFSKDLSGSTAQRTLATSSPRDARNTSVDQFWARSGAGMSLHTSDLARSECEPASVRAGPYSNNACLVGSRWRYIERPKVGQPLYTDFYGPVGGGATSDYYGRSYSYAPQ